MTRTLRSSRGLRSPATLAKIWSWLPPGKGLKGRWQLAQDEVPGKQAEWSMVCGLCVPQAPPSPTCEMDRAED